jgi:hypothetical protein
MTPFWLHKNAVPSLQLGWWVATQRRNKTELSKERRTRLNKVGFVWNARMGPSIAYRRKNEARSKAFDNFCKAHPLDSITTAAFELTDELRSATGNVLFRS